MSEPSDMGRAKAACIRRLQLMVVVETAPYNIFVMYLLLFDRNVIATMFQ
jgi:hypothetical protein